YGVPLLGGKVAWIFGAIFHMFSHPVYIVYRQDWDFIENKFLNARLLPFRKSRLLQIQPPRRYYKWQITRGLTRHP
ncbi:MAG: hypothetical protein FWE21_10655, partial [Defluviitaleaceae bacterium]|nr:hypothetical protein [Defluviitaleaceae bacterium]